MTTTIPPPRLSGARPVPDMTLRETLVASVELERRRGSAHIVNGYDRRKSIGSSDASRIMSGKWADLWLEKTSRKDPDDLSNVLVVQLGLWTEGFNRLWFERITGNPVKDAGTMCVHPTLPFLTCTLDGRVRLTSGDEAVFEAKHVGGREPLDIVIARYQPQVQHQMHVTGTNLAVLSCLIGTDRYEYVEIPRDDFYLAELVEREIAFWRHVEADEPPPDLEPIAAPVPPEEWKTVDFTGNNAWADSAAEWLEYKGHASRFKCAEKILKEMIGADVGIAYGHGVIVKRDRANRLGIKEHTADAK